MIQLKELRIGIRQYFIPGGLDPNSIFTTTVAELKSISKLHSSIIRVVLLRWRMKKNIISIYLGWLRKRLGWTSLNYVTGKLIGILCLVNGIECNCSGNKRNIKLLLSNKKPPLLLTLFFLAF